MRKGRPALAAPLFWWRTTHIQRHTHLVQLRARARACVHKRNPLPPHAPPHTLWRLGATTQGPFNLLILLFLLGALSMLYITRNVPVAIATTVAIMAINE